MKGVVQCPNCLSYRVIILKKLHYGIFLAISSTIATFCLWFVLTQHDGGPMDIVTVGGSMLFTITTIILAVKITASGKADVLCTRCGFRFKTNKC